MSKIKTSINKIIIGILINLGANSLCFANPELLAPNDSINIQRTENLTEITQFNDKAIIDWKNFDILPNETTKFIQPSSSSIAINRIHDDKATSILGNLEANGKIVLINPYGILFSKDATVNVGSIIATTSGITDQNFQNNNFIFDQASNVKDAMVMNEGLITAADAGLVGLVSPRVVNNGIITANLGNIEIASADKFTVDFYGNKLFEFAIENKDTEQLLQHKGKSIANDGKINITAAAGREIIDNIIEIKGELKAPSITKIGNKIVISAKKSNSKKSNKIKIDNAVISTANGNSKIPASNIEITADIIDITGNTLIDASSSSKPGEIYIGGAFRGYKILPASKFTHIGKDVIIDVSAKESGNAGKAIIWADDHTYFYGTVNAAGGAYEGNGGFVEVSGKNFLKYSGYVNSLANNGKAGTLLLDPSIITIKDGSGIGDGQSSSSSFSGIPSGGLGSILSSDTSSTTLYLSEINGISATTNIVLAATNSIIIEPLTSNLTAGQDLTFTTGSGGFIMQNINNNISCAGTLRINTSGGSSTIGNLIGNGNVILDITGSASINNINLTGVSSNISYVGPGSITLSSLNSYQGDTNISQGSFLFNSNSPFGSGNVILSGGAIFNNTSSSPITINNAIGLGGNLLTINDSGGITFTGIISGSNGSITYSSNKILTLSEANTYSGTTNFSSGTLKIANNSALGSSTLLLNGGNLQDDGTARSINNNISLTGNSGIAGSAALTFAGNFSNTGNFTLTNNNTASVTFSGDVNLSNSASNYILTIAGTGVTNISGLIANGGTSTASGLAISGSALLYLSNNSNNYLGATTVNSGATLKIGGNSAISSSSIILNGGNLQDDGTARSINNNISLTGNSSIAGSAALTFAGNFSNTGNFTLTNNNTASVTFSGNVNLSNSASNYILTIAGTGVTNISGLIANGGTSTASGLAISGSALLYLSNNSNSYLGATTVNSGATLKIGGNSAISSSSIILNGGNLQDDGTARSINNNITLNTNSSINAVTSLVLNGVISSSGSYNLSFNGTGTLAFTNNNTYSGATKVNSGTFKISSSSNIGSAALELSGSSILTNDGNSNINISQNLTLLNTPTITAAGGYSITFSGSNVSGTATLLTLNNNVIFSGLTTLALPSATINSINNNLQILASGAITTGAINSNNTGYSITINSSAGSISTGNISANQNVNISSFANLNTGSITATSGNISITTTSSSSASSISNISALNGTVALNFAGPSSTATIGSINALSMNYTGSATTTLSSSNSFTSGGITINSGTIIIANNNALGAGSTNVYLNGGIIKDNGTAKNISNSLYLTASSTISGTAGLTFTGNFTNQGNFTLTNNNPNTVFSGSNFYLSNNSSSNILTFQGTGQTSISSVIADTATSGANSSLFVNAGTLILSAANTYSGSTTINTGAILKITDNSNISSSSNLILSGGTIADNGSAVTISTPINLTANSIISGTSSITLSGVFTNNGNYTINNNNTNASFGVNFTNNVKLSNNATNYTLTFSGSGITKVSGAGAIINGPSSASNISVAGTGTLYLTTANTYTGTTILTSGTLLLGYDNAISSSSNLILSGGTLSNDGTAINISNTTTLNGNFNIAGSASFTFSGNITDIASSRLTNNNSSLVFDSSSTLFLSNNSTASYTTNFSGPGLITIKGIIANGASSTSNLRISGTGTVYLNNGTNSSYTGTTTITSGILKIDTASSLSTNSLVLAGGSLTNTGSIINISQNISCTSASILLGNAGYNLSGAISGSGGITYNGTNTLYITGTNTSYTGSITANSGSIIKISNANALGSGSITLNNATLQDDGNQNISINNNFVITGASYISSFNSGGNNLSINGTISGSDSSSTLTLSSHVLLTNVANINYAGSIIYTGDINIISSGSIIAKNLSTSGGSITLTANGGPITAENLSANQNITLTAYNGINTGIISATNGNISIVAGTSNTSNTSSITSITASASNVSITIGGASSTATIGAISTNIFTYQGPGNTNLTAANTFTSTVINSGTITIGTANAFGNSSVTVAGNATILNNSSSYIIANNFILNANITFGGSASISLNGLISGTGSLGYSGTSSATLTPTNPSNSYTGGTIMNSGTVIVSNPSVINNILLTLNGGTFTYNGVSTLNISNLIINSAASTINGTGNINILGNISGNGGITFATSSLIYITSASASLYSGPTIINSGTIKISNSNALGTGSITLSGGGLENDGTSNISFANSNNLIITNSASITALGGYSITFSGNVSGNNASATLTLNNSIIFNVLSMNISSNISANTDVNITSASLATTGIITTSSGNVSIATSGASTSSIAGINATGNLTTNIGLGSQITISNIAILGTYSNIGAGITILPTSNSFGNSATNTQGTITIGNNSSLGGNNVNLYINGGTIQDNGSAIVTANSNIFLNGNVIFAGSGGITFTGTFTNTGNYTITNNNTKLVSGIVFSYNFILSNSNTNYTLTFAGSGNSLISGNITNGGTSVSAITLTSGTLRLTASNSYTGATKISGGYLQIGHNNSLSTSAVNLNGGTLQDDNSGIITINNSITLTANSYIAARNQLVITGVISSASTYNLNFNGSGKLTLASYNSYSGISILTSGTVVIANNNSFGSSTIQLAGGTLSDNGSVIALTNTISISASSSINTISAITLFGTISGGSGYTISLNSTGSGSLTISGNNTSLNANLNIAGGSLVIGNNNALGSGVLTLSGTSTIKDNNINITISNNIVIAGNVNISAVNQLNLSGVISGTNSFSLNLNGTGVVYITNNNSSYFSNTTLTSGKLIFGSNTALNNATLLIAGGTISDDGTARSISNPLTINANILITGSAGLSFTNTISINGSYIITNSTSSLSFATITYNSASTLTINSSGDLNITGNITFFNSASTQKLIISGNSNVTLSGIIQDSALSNGQLIINNNNITYIKGANSFRGGTTINSSGILKIGNASAFGTGALAITNGATLTDDNAAYIIANSIALSSPIYIKSNNKITFTGVISGGSLAVINLNGAGIVYFKNSNTYSGNTNLYSGTMMIGQTSACGSATINIYGGVIVDDGLASYVIPNNININASTSILVSSTYTLTLSGVISSSNSSYALSFIGNGTVYLNNNNTHTGTSIIQSGFLKIGHNNCFGNSTIQLNGGSIIDDSLSSYIIANNFVFTSLTNITLTNNITLSGSISGNGGFVISGNQILNITGNNSSYSGSFTISNQTILRFSNSNSLGTGNIILNGGTLQTTSGISVVINNNIILQSASYISTNNTNSIINIAGIISNNNSSCNLNISNSNTGTVIISNINNSYYSSTYVNSGTLQINNGNAITYSTIYLAGGTLSSGNNITLTTNIIISNSSTIKIANIVTISGNISSTGNQNLIINGGGYLYLTGTNTNSGTVNITSTTVQVANNYAFGTANIYLNGCTIINNSSSITFNNNLYLNGTTVFSGTNSITFTQNVTDIGSSTVINNNTGGLNFTGSNFYLSNTTTYNTTFQGNSTITISANIQNGSGSTSNLIYNGTGTFIVTGNNSYTGTTNILSGIIIVTTGFGTSGSVINLGGCTLSDNGSLITINNIINLQGTLTLTGTVGITFTQNIIDLRSSTIINNNSGIVSFNGTYFYLSNFASSYTTTLQGSGVTNINSIIANGASSTSNLIYSGTGTLYLTGVNTYSGTTTIISGTIKIGNSSIFGSSVVNCNGSTIIDNAPSTYIITNNLIISVITNINIAGNVTFSGLISGSSSISLSGTGTIILSGNNSFSGTINIYSGIVTMGNNNCFGTSIVNFYGGTLKDNGTAISITTASFILRTNNPIFMPNSNITITTVVSGSGGFKLNGTGTLYLTGNNTYSGTTIISSGTIRIGNNSALGTSVVNLNGGTLSDDGTIRTIGNIFFLNGSVSLAGTAGLNFTQNITDLGSSIIINNNSGIVHFSGTYFYLSNFASSYTTTLQGSGVINITSIIANGASSISNLIYSGTGTLYLTGANTYSGTTTIISGIIKIGNNSAFGTSVINFNGGTLSDDGTIRTIGNIFFINGSVSLAGTAGLNFTQNITDLGSSIIINNNSGVVNFSGTYFYLSNFASSYTTTLQGSGVTNITSIIANGASSISNLIYSGTGTLYLTGGNTYSGTTTIISGIIKIGNNSAFGTSVINFFGGTLQDNGSAISITQNTFNLQNNNPIFAPISTITISTIISGSGGFKLSGVGTLYLTGANTYSGITNIISGTIKIGHNTAFGTSILNLSGGTIIDDSLFIYLINNNITILSSGSVNINIAGNVTFTNIINGNGTISLSGLGTINISGVNNLFAGVINIYSGTVIMGSNDCFGTSIINFYGGILKDNGTAISITTSNFVLQNNNPVFAPVSTINITTVITGTGGFTLTSISGKLYLAASNSYTGETNISSGTLQINSNNALGTSALNLNGGNILYNGTLVNLNNINVNINGSVTFTGNGGISFSGTIRDLGSSTITNNLSNVNYGLSFIGSNIYLSNNSNNSYTTIFTGSGITTINGIIRNGAAVTSKLTYSGTGTLYLNAANTYSGGTNIISGIIEIGNNSALGTSVVNLNGGTLSDNGNVINISNVINVISNSGIIATNNFTISANLSTASITNTLTINGAGTINLLNVNNFIGKIIVNSSTIILGSNFSGLLYLNNSTISDNNIAVLLNNNIVISGNSYISAVNSITISGVISNINVTDSIIFAGNINLSGHNIYSAATIISSGAVINITAINVLPSGSSITVNANANLYLNGHIQTFYSINVIGNIYFGNNNTITTSGNQVYVGSIYASQLTLISNSGNIIASNNNNQITDILTLNAPNGYVNFRNSGNLLLGKVNATTIHVEVLSGNLYLNDQLIASATTGNAIFLTTSQNIFNNYGNNAIVTSGSAYFYSFATSVTTSQINNQTGLEIVGCINNSGTPLCSSGVSFPSNTSIFFFLDVYQLTITGITANNKIYDGTVTATISGTPILVGAPNGSGISLNYQNATYTFADKNVGNNIAVTISGYTVTPDYGYTLLLPTLSANITPLSIPVSGLSAQDKIYNNNVNAVITGTAVISPLGSDIVSVIGTPTGIFANKNVGTNIPVSVLGLTLSGQNASNYNILNSNSTIILSAPISANITKYDLQISGVTANNKGYDNNTNATLSGFAVVYPLGSDIVSVAGTPTAIFASANVGNNIPVTVTGYYLTGTDSGNYNPIQPQGLHANITQYTVYINGITANNKVYNANTDATITGTPELYQIFGNDNITLIQNNVTATFATKNVGNNIAVSVTGYSISGIDAYKYTLVQPTTLSANITPANITLHGVSGVNKVYDTTVAANVTGTPVVTPLIQYIGNVAIADNVFVTGQIVANFVSPNVGNNIEVDISGASISGTDAANYILVYNNITANITPYPLHITNITANNKIYDGTTTTSVSGTPVVTPLSGTSVTVTGTGSANFVNPNVGNNIEVDVTNYSLSGPDAHNYYLIQPTTLSANITPFGLEVFSLSASNEIYNGVDYSKITGNPQIRPDSSLQNFFLDLILLDLFSVSSERANVYIVGTPNGVFVPYIPGINVPVVVSGLSLAGISASNYYLKPIILRANLIDINPSKPSLPSTIEPSLPGTLNDFNINVMKNDRKYLYLITLNNTTILVENAFFNVKCIEAHSNDNPFKKSKECSEYRKYFNYGKTY